MIRILTRSDDAGAARSANRAIRDACEKGISRNISFIACGPEIEHAAETLGDLKNVAFGMHISMNCEWQFPRHGPVSDPATVPELVDEDGNLTFRPHVLHERKVSVEQIMIEVRAQLARLRSLGLDVAYMDQHMGVGWVHDDLERAFAQFAAQEGLVYEKSVSLDPLPIARGADDENGLDAVRNALRSVGSGTYLMIAHPVYPGSDFYDHVLPGQSNGMQEAKFNNQRLKFMDEEIVRIIEERNIDLIRYTDL